VAKKTLTAGASYSIELTAGASYSIYSLALIPTSKSTNKTNILYAQILLNSVQHKDILKAHFIKLHKHLIRSLLKSVVWLQLMTMAFGTGSECMICDTSGSKEKSAKAAKLWSTRRSQRLQKFVIHLWGKGRSFFSSLWK